MTDPKQAKCLTDPSWKFYRDTDVARTFRRIRARMKAEADKQQQAANVRPMKARAK